MIFPQDFEEKTGFHSLRQDLINICETRLGKEAASDMKFSSDYKEIKENLESVRELKGLLESGNLPTDIIYDILPMITSLKSEGSYLSGEQLSHLAATMQTMQSFNNFFNNSNEEIIETPVLSKYFGNMPVYPEIIKEIQRCIEPYGDVKDNASSNLLDIRIKIRRAEGSIQRAMQTVLQSAIREKIIDKDTSAGIRDGRMVIPVNAANKKSVKGVVHGMSATGKTVFIEPIEVLEASNRLRELENEESIEIVEILKTLSGLLRPNIDEIKRGALLLGKYDFIRAKSRFAISSGGEMPHIEKEPEIEWYHAIHPGLLFTLQKQGKSPVPLDIHLTKEQRILIISGPNAGGKSVCLKTVAVVQYMMQCGMLPTLYYNSHMGVFKNILIDIGDEQSFENDLSTYSSHLSNMKQFLAHSGKGTLVLADEMGSGTEPQIGGALAQSILSRLGKSGCMGIITTHYQNLKTFADNEPGFVNGAMLYDRQHLQPTFQLSIGFPGSSFALDIARKIGLPKDVVDMAKEIVGNDYINLDKYILDIQRDRRYWQNKRLNIKEKEHKLDKLLENYEETSAELKRTKGSILKAARQEAKEILDGANKIIERSIHEIKKAEAEKERTRQIRKELQEYKEEITNSDSNDEKLKGIKQIKNKRLKKQHSSTKASSHSIESKIDIGSYVRLNEGGVTGKVLSIEGNKAEVAFGTLRSTVDLKKLVLTGKPKENIKNTTVNFITQTDDSSRERQLKFKNEIDVRGMRADEALQAVTYFLDDAIQFNAGRLRILHGTGNGILKTLIRKQLKANPIIKSFEDEDVRFGGAGITVIEL